jgi:hypothetical protein
MRKKKNFFSDPLPWWSPFPKRYINYSKSGDGSKNYPKERNVYSRSREKVTNLTSLQIDFRVNLIKWVFPNEVII